MSYKEKGQEAYDLRKEKKTYSKKDDKIILKYVEKQGVSNETFNLCAKTLGRVDGRSVSKRYKLLMSKGGGVSVKLSIL